MGLLVHPPLGREGPAAPLGPGAGHRAHHRHRHRRVRRPGEHRGVAPAVERRVLRHAAHVRPAGDRRRGRGRPHRARWPRCWPPCPIPAIVATAEERFIADTQVDASTADKSILVPGRLVGMDLSDGGPHVNGVYVAEGNGRPLSESDAGRPVVLVEQNFADFYDLPPERTLRVAGNQEVTQRRHRPRPRVLLRDDRGGRLLRRSQLRRAVHLAGDRPATWPGDPAGSTTWSSSSRPGSTPRPPPATSRRRSPSRAPASA